MRLPTDLAFRSTRARSTGQPALTGRPRTEPYTLDTERDTVRLTVPGAGKGAVIVPAVAISEHAVPQLPGVRVRVRGRDAFIGD